MLAARGVATRVCQLVQHFGLDWNISATIKWIKMKLTEERKGHTPNPTTCTKLPLWIVCTKISNIILYNIPIQLPCIKVQPTISFMILTHFISSTSCVLCTSQKMFPNKINKLFPEHLKLWAAATLLAKMIAGYVIRYPSLKTRLFWFRAFILCKICIVKLNLPKSIWRLLGPSFEKGCLKLKEMRH